MALVLLALLSCTWGELSGGENRENTSDKVAVAPAETSAGHTDTEGAENAVVLPGCVGISEFSEAECVSQNGGTYITWRCLRGTMEGKETLLVFPMGDDASFGEVAKLFNGSRVCVTETLKAEPDMIALEGWFEPCGPACPGAELEPREDQD